MPGMKAVFRSLLLWLMLLAIPFQGVASASMLLCGPATAAAPSQAPSGPPAMAAGHDHAAMLAAAAQASHDGGQDERGMHDSHGPSKCGSTGACCVGAALAPALPVLPQLPAASSQFISFHSGRLPAVDLALPERPPRAARV
jgi:hypothetical protein